MKLFSALVAFALATAPALSKAEFFDTEKRSLINMGLSCKLQENSPQANWDACFAIHYLLSSEGVGSVIYTAMQAAAAPAGDATSPQTCQTLKDSVAEITAKVDANFEIITGQPKAGNTLYTEIQTLTAAFSGDVDLACKGTNATVAGLDTRILPLKEKLTELLK